MLIKDFFSIKYFVDISAIIFLVFLFFGTVLIKRINFFQLFFQVFMKDLEFLVSF